MKKEKFKWDVAMGGVQTGRSIVIRKEPPKAKRTGFLFGTKHEIIEPPKGYLNSHMAVWLEGSDGKARCLDFPYWALLPEGVKFHQKEYIKNHTQIKQEIEYVPTIMPEYNPNEGKLYSEYDEPVKRRRSSQSVEVQDVAVRRRRKN